jgi:hypothetical protein
MSMNASVPSDATRHIMLHCYFYQRFETYHFDHSDSKKLQILMALLMEMMKMNIITVTSSK